MVADETGRGKFGRGRRREKRPPRPLDETSLKDLALAYVARYATTRAKLTRYLARKLRERGWEGEGSADVEALVDRYTELGYIDDAAWAQSRAGGLARRGYGPRRIGQDLRQAGIASEDSEPAMPNELEAREAALAMARKRRFGPFALQSPDERTHEKQLAAMLRAGHRFDAAKFVLGARGEQEIEEWIDEERDTGAPGS